MPTVNYSHAYRPGRWFMLAAVACLAGYLFGVVSATPDGTAPSPPSAVCIP